MRSSLSLVACLAFACLTTSASATEGSCAHFDDGQAAPFQACTYAPQVTVNTSNAGSKSGPMDYFLRLLDLSGSSAACTSDKRYTGNWIEKFGSCPQFCYDFRLINSGNPPGPITPSITLFNGTKRATFVANFTMIASPDSAPEWKRICPPIKQILNGEALPSNAQGEWRINNSNGHSADWNSIITGVTSLELPIDFTSSPSEVAGYDNFCIGLGECPSTAKPDLTIEKKRTNGNYTIQATNSGGALYGPVRIEVVDMVPAGMTVTNVTAPAPWTCTPTSMAVGPDVVTCTTMIEAGSKLDANAALPAIVLSAKGKPACKNCARVRAYEGIPAQSPLSGVPGSNTGMVEWRPFDEVNRSNNASCAD